MRLLLAFFLLIAVGTSCRKGELIGREVQIGDNDIFLKTSDSFHISARTIKANIERTDERFLGMIGAYMDPIFGKSIISYASQYHLEKEGFAFPKDAIFDSAFISFKLDGGYREKAIDGRVREHVHYQVFELGQDLVYEDNYFSDEQIRTQPTLIGEYNGLIGLYDTIHVGNEEQPSQIRIPLTDAWGQKMVKADSINYLTNESFTQFMKGVIVKPIQTNQVGSNGSIFYFNPLSAFTGITIHYHTSSDTTKFQFVTTSFTANLMTFEHDYDAASIGPIIGDTAKGSQELYLQATIGTDIQIELKDIVEKFGSNPKIINIAELIIPVDTNQPYAPITKLSVSRKLENGTAEFLPDQIQTGNRVVDGAYYADSAYYRFQITQYIQEIIHNYDPNRIKSEILLISPFGNNTSANRSVISGPRPGTPGQRQMKIIITYTPL